MRRYRITDLAAWDDLVSACAGATWFHRSAWQGAVAEAVGGRFEGALFEAADGSIGLVPIVRRPAARGWGTDGVGGTRAGLGGYGGLIASAAWDRSAVEQAFGLLGREAGDWHLAGNPHAPGPHLPASAGPLATAWVLPLEPATPAGADPDLFWAPGPKEFQADRLGALEASPDSRPAALCYHLFRRTDARTLVLALRLDAGRPVAGALVGLDGAIAYVAVLVGAPHHRAALVGQLAARLSARARQLDLGLAPEGPAGAVARPVAAWRRISAASRLVTRLRRDPRRAS